MNYKILENSFLGTTISKDKSYTIIGAGFSGLIVGYWLKKWNIDFKIVEIEKKAGGLLGSQKSTHGIAEQAANGLLWTPELEVLIKDLDLNGLAPNQASKKRFILQNNQLTTLPLNYSEIAKVLLNLTKRQKSQFYTLRDFGYATFGERFSLQMLEPGFTGIYAAGINQLSFPGTMKKLASQLNKTSFIPVAFWKMRKQADKKVRSGTQSFQNGMQDLVSGLEQHLKGYIAYESDGLAYNRTDENLILTVPAYVAKNFFYGQMQKKLSLVEYIPLISMTFFIKKSKLKNFMDGFGCLIPRTENYKILGVLFNSCIFDNRVEDPENLSLTCIVRDFDQQLLQLPDEVLMHIVFNELRAIFDIDGDPLDYTIFRWPKAIPLYSPGLHLDWFEMDKILKEEFPNINLFGNYTGEISLRGMIQTIFKNTPV